MNATIKRERLEDNINVFRKMCYSYMRCDTEGMDPFGVVMIDLHISSHSTWLNYKVKKKFSHPTGAFFLVGGGIDYQK